MTSWERYNRLCCRKILRILPISVQPELSPVPTRTTKSIPLKGLYGQILDYQDFLGLMSGEARSEWKDYLWRQRLKAAPPPRLGTDAVA